MDIDSGTIHQQIRTAMIVGVLLIPFTSILSAAFLRAAFAVLRATGHSFISLYATVLLGILIEFAIGLASWAGVWIARHGDQEIALVAISLLKAMASLLTFIGLLAWRHHLSFGKAFGALLLATAIGIGFVLVVACVVGFVYAATGGAW